MTFSMRNALGFLLLCLVISTSLRAQKPADGRLTAHSYENAFFNIVYSWPKMLHANDLATLEIKKSPLNNEFPLFSVQQGNSPFGIIAIAEKTGPTATSKGFNNPSEFVDFLLQGFKAGENLKVLSRRHVKNAAGIDFEEVDYQSKYGQFESGIATQSGQFLMVFRCDAQSAEDLSAMTKSVLESRRLR